MMLEVKLRSHFNGIIEDRTYVGVLMMFAFFGHEIYRQRNLVKMNLWRQMRKVVGMKG